MEKIGIIGQGFVGSAIYQGMKDHFDVLTFDKDPNKVCNTKSTYDVVKDAEIIFVCVPTPMQSDGSCDLSILRKALLGIEESCRLINCKRIAIIKSTIPPGTTDQLNKEFSSIDIVFSPEFLTEANAVEDFINQDRIVVGSHNDESIDKVYKMFDKAFPDIPILITIPQIAEMVKYVTNTFLAMKVSYANEIYQLCDKMGMSYNRVIEYATYDKRLGKSHWQVPGPDGKKFFGGSCLLKDINALIKVYEENGIDCPMITSAWTACLNGRESLQEELDELCGRAVSKKINISDLK